MNAQDSRIEHIISCNNTAGLLFDENVQVDEIEKVIVNLKDGLDYLYQLERFPRILEAKLLGNLGVAHKKIGTKIYLKKALHFFKKLQTLCIEWDTTEEDESQVCMDCINISFREISDISRLLKT